MKLLHETHDDVEFIDCFNSIGLQTQFLPVKIKTRPCIGILKKKNNVRPAEFLAYQMNDSVDGYANSDEMIDDLKESILLDPPTQIEEDIDIIKELSSTIEPQHLNEPTISFDAFNSPPESTKFGQSTTKIKLKKIIESHFRAKGSVIETDKESDRGEVTEDWPTKESNREIDLPALSSHPSAKANIKRIIKAEQIKELVESISKLDLNVVCDLEHLTTKECLKKIIDDYDVWFMNGILHTKQCKHAPGTEHRFIERCLDHHTNISLRGNRFVIWHDWFCTFAMLLGINVLLFCITCPSMSAFSKARLIARGKSLPKFVNQKFWFH